MKKIIIILNIAIIISASYAERFPIGCGAYLGYLLEENNNRFMLGSNILINIVKNFYVRTEIVNVTFPSGSTLINLGTGSAIDLMLYFPAQSIDPYGLVGFNFMSTSNYTDLNIRFGGGIEFLLGIAPIHPFTEIDLNVTSRKLNNVSSSHTVVGLKAGIRMK